MSPARALAPLLLLALTAPAGAPAAPGPAFGLKALGTQRGWFVYDAAAGQTLTGRVRVVNAGGRTGTVRLRPADAATGRTTGVVYETRAVRSVGTWLRLGSERLTLGPGESAVVSFTVTVPPGAGPGDHLGGIVAQPETTTAQAASAKGKRAFRVNVVEQSIVAVQVAVPGVAGEELALTGVRAGADPGYQTLLIGIRNPGDRLVRGTGAVRVTGEDGRLLRRQAFAVDTFVPGTQVEDPIVLRGRALPAGDYQASVVLRWGDGRSTTLRAPFTVSDRQVRQAYGSPGVSGVTGTGAPEEGGGPGVAVIAGGALLILLAGIGGTTLYFRRRTRALAARLAPPEAGEGHVTVTDRRPPRVRDPR